MDLEEEIALAIADAQNVPFVGPKQKRITAAVMPLVWRAQAEALDRAVGAIADLRPGGFTMIGSADARRRDEVLWEAQSTVQRMVRGIEKEAGDEEI